MQQAYEYSIKKKEDVLFVSFNYDLLLENALSKVHRGIIQLVSIPEYITSPLKIIKPHGSCNWFKRIELPDTKGLHGGDFIYENKYSLRQINELLENNIKIINNPLGATETVNSKHVHYFPQILVPLKDKDDFVLPEAHKKCLNDNLHKVNEILIIGWKGTEGEFQNLLKTKIGSKPVKITCINAGFKDIEQHMRLSLPNASFTHFGEPAFMPKYNNTLIKLDLSDRRRAIRHDPGTFSSYILNILMNKTKSFFD